MADNEYYYTYYRNKYYESINQINQCDNELSSLRSRRRVVVNEINSLNAEIRTVEDAIEDLGGILKCEEDINDKLTEIGTKMSDASINYTGMVSSSDVNNKDLTNVFSQETTATKNAVSGAFQTVRNKKTSLETQIAEKRRQLTQYMNERSDLDVKISTEQAERNERERQKSNNWCNMEYYKRKMQQEQGW